MTEVFRQRVETPVEPEIEVQATQPTEVVSDTLQGNETLASDPMTLDEKNLEVWEGLNKRNFITEYFGVGNIDGEFNLKMQTATIDKYIKGELEKKGYEKNIENYKEILQEIEEETGSSRLELFERIKKLTGYAKVLNKMEELKKKKKLYIPE